MPSGRGPRFFHVLRASRAAVVLVVGVLLAAGGVALAAGNLLGPSGPHISGIYAGA